MKKLITLLLLLTVSACFAQKVSLALNLKPDSTYNLVTNARMTIDQDIPGHHQVVNTHISAKVSHKVISIKDSIYEMEVKYKAMSFHLDVGAVVMNFSSGGISDGNPLSKILIAMIDKPFVVDISKSGRVLAVKGMDNIYNNMFDGLPQVNEAQKAQFKSQMQASFGEKAIRTNFQEAFDVFPAAAIGANDKWEATSTVESMLSVKIKTLYTLMNISTDAYLIHGEATIKSGDDMAYKPSMGMMMRLVNLTGGATTDLKLDNKTCWISESKISKSIKCTAEIQDGPKTPGGLTFPMSLVLDMTVSSK